MEKKKSNKANLEKMKSMFLIIGLGISFAIMNYAFSFQSKISETNVISSESVIDNELIPITKPPDEKPKPKPQKVNYIADIIRITESTEKIDETEFVIPEFTDEPILDDIPEESDEPVFNPSIKPEFPGGLSALQQYIVKHIEYPELAKENNIQGTVFLRFEITKKGTVGKISVMNNTVDKILQKEALRVIKTLPKFKPGIQNGKPVNVWYSLPVSFKLN